MGQGRIDDKPVYLRACGKTAEYFQAHPDVAEELARAVHKHVDSNPELRRQLDRQEARFKELGIGRDRR